MDRVEREKKAYDHDNTWEKSNNWHMRFKHVFESPNTMRNEKLFEDIIKQNCRRKKVLDIGCSEGDGSQMLLSLGASYVYGIDISEIFILEAKKREKKGIIEFANKDVMKPIQGRFDLIFGRSILHHIDYQEVLKRLFSENLNSQGLMAFMEPLGSNLLIRLNHLIAKSTFTPDERPFYRSDLKWLKDNFRQINIIPINYFSLIFGIFSSFIFANADNYLLRFCDIMDCWIEKNMKIIIPNYRQALFIIRKDL